MATIRKHVGKKRITWHVEIRRRGHPPIFESFTTRREAEGFASRIESNIHRGEHFGIARVRTVGDLLDKYEPLTHKLRTAADRLRHLDWWRTHYGTVKLDKFGTDILSEAREHLSTELVKRNSEQPDAAAKPRSSQTVRHYLNAIGCALEYARVGLRWLDSNPCRDVEKPPPAPARVRWLTDAERLALLRECDASQNPDLTLVVLLALSSGARYGEIVGLRWPQVDLGNRVAWLGAADTKTQRARALPIVGRAAHLLKARSKIRRVDTDLLFPGEADPKKPRNMQQAFAVACRRAELAGLRFHDLRHDAATTMLRAGVDSRVVASVLGHTTLAMMQRYQHVAPDFVVRAAVQGAKRAGL